MKSRGNGTAGHIGATMSGGSGMKWNVFVAVALLAACGGTASSSRSATSPMLSADTCALHQDSSRCRADAQGCVWYANTRPCQEPCPAGWCSNPQATDGGTTADGGIAASAGCACPGIRGDACVMEIGGPAVQQPPSITCDAIPESCTLPDRCGCLASSSLGACRSSDQVTNLCICDNGIR
jgi:hypothetical protein